MRPPMRPIFQGACVVLFLSASLAEPGDDQAAFLLVFRKAKK